MTPVTLPAQAPSIKTSVNKTSILIGEHFNYTIETQFPQDEYDLTLPEFPDSILGFEVVERKKIDSVETNGLLKCSKTIVFTSFDSGIHTIPQMLVNFDPYRDDTTLNFFTDSIVIKVAFAPADSVKTFHDIKPIIEVEEEIEWWIWIAGAISFVILYFIVKELIKRKKKPQAVEASQPLFSPYEEAMRSLDELEQQKLLEKNEVKQYHSRLAAIFKKYLSRKQAVNFAGLTSGELLVKIDSPALDQSSVSSLANALRMGDAVKFAKYIPAKDDSENCFSVIKQTIQSMN